MGEDAIESGDPERMFWKDIPITTKDGTQRIISAKNIPLSDLDIMISTVTDETDRYWAEHSLRVSDERFHLATQAVSDAIWDWDIPNNSIFFGYRIFSPLWVSGRNGKCSGRILGRKNSS